MKGFAKFQRKLEGREVVEPKEYEGLFYSRPRTTFRHWQRIMETNVDHIDGETLIDGFNWSSTEQGHDFWSGIHRQLRGSVALGQLTCDESARARNIIRSWQRQDYG